MPARSRSAQRAPAHRPDQCRGSAPFSPASNGQVAAERRAGSSCACRSGLLWFSASTASRRPMNPARQTRSNDALSSPIARLNMARSGKACSFWMWMWIAQMSFGLTGGFLPTSFPLFQASRLLMASLTDSLLVDRSVIRHHTWRRQLSSSKLAGWTATATTGIATVIAATQS